MYIPTSQLDGLYARRLSPTVLSQISFVSFPSESSSVSRRARSNLTLGLQHDTGRWSSEYSYSVGDGMLGARVMHNFGQLQGNAAASASGLGLGGNSMTSFEKQQRQQRREKRVDEEESLGKGLRGRFSAGAEIFFSALEKSGGGEMVSRLSRDDDDRFCLTRILLAVSTGVRFMTIPDSPSVVLSSDGSEIAPSQQPPTVITATFNPVVGAISTAYAAKVTRDLALCSRSASEPLLFSPPSSP
jgi:mitochondrial distribution and morphology protein 10